MQEWVFLVTTRQSSKDIVGLKSVFRMAIQKSVKNLTQASLLTTLYLLTLNTVILNKESPVLLGMYVHVCRKMQKSISVDIQSTLVIAVPVFTP